MFQIKLNNPGVELNFFCESKHSFRRRHFLDNHLPKSESIRPFDIRIFIESWSCAKQQSATSNLLCMLESEQRRLWSCIVDVSATSFDLRLCWCFTKVLRKFCSFSLRRFTDSLQLKHSISISLSCSLLDFWQSVWLFIKSIRFKYFVKPPTRPNSARQTW